jgi:hypothetical protein
MIGEQRNETVAVSWLCQVEHLMHNDVFDQIFGFLHEFGVQSDKPDLMIIAPPLGFHPLEEISPHPHTELRFPFADQGRNKLMQEGLMPFVDNRRSFRMVTA